jgi:hypothetical protein
VEEALRKGNDALARKAHVTAMSWFRKAADQGSAAGQLALAQIYADVQPQDFKKAMYWYRKAADQGNAEAQSGVGWLYTTGRGVTLDAAQGMLWYRKAADQGHAPSQTVIGGLYELGDGVEQDFDQALAWYQRAANQGYDFAEFRLGRMYLLGRGIPPDREVGTEWMRKAAQHGSEEARNYLQNPASLAEETASERPSTDSQASAGTTQATDAPSDDEVINATKANIKREVVQSIEAEYGNIDNLGPNAMSFLMNPSPAAAPAVLACSLNTPEAKRACMVKAVAKLRAERDAKIKDARNDDAGRVFVFAVQRKTNYEGNYIAFVMARQRGTDKAYQMKVLLVRCGAAALLASGMAPALPLPRSCGERVGVRGAESQQSTSSP